MQKKSCRQTSQPQPPNQREKMNAADEQEEEEEEEEYLGVVDEDDIIQEISIDEEDLPDADDEDEQEEVAECSYIFTGHKGEVYTVACSPMDPTLVATGGQDDKGFLWNINQVDSHFELQGHKETVSAVAFSTDGKLLATGCLKGLIQIWDTSSKYRLGAPLEGSGGPIEWLRWHPSEHLVLAGSEDSTVSIWDADKNACLNMFYCHGGSVTCGDFTPDGKTICTGFEDATLRICGENSHVVRGHPYHTEGLTCLVISSDSTFALTGSMDGSVHKVNIKTGKVVNSLLPHSTEEESIKCIGLAPSLALAATGSSYGKLIIWDIQHSSLRCTCYHEDEVNCLTWLGESEYVATGCADGRIYIWNSLSGDCVKIFLGHSGKVQSLAVSTLGGFLVSVSFDGDARVFDISEYM